VHDGHTEWVRTCLRWGIIPPRGSPAGAESCDSPRSLSVRVRSRRTVGRPRQPKEVMNGSTDRDATRPLQIAL
jgi:hypothetical protein